MYIIKKNKQKRPRTPEELDFFYIVPQIVSQYFLASFCIFMLKKTQTK